MSFKKISIVTALVSGLVVSASANANEVSLEQLISATMTQVVKSTKQELTNNVQKAVLTANNMIDLNSTQEFATKVTITDIEDQEEMPSKAE